MRIWDRLQAWVSRADQRCYYWILTLALLLPNVVLSVVMQQPAVGRVLNILLMLPVYMLLLLSAKRPGRVYWGLFVLVLLHAFQLVLLTIFSGSVVAVDMLLNIFTSEPDEAGELLSNILWPILASGGFYALTFVVARLSRLRAESVATLPSPYGPRLCAHPSRRPTYIYRGEEALPLRASACRGLSDERLP